MLVLVIVVLLIAIPFGYLVRSAMQSRESGVQKQRMAAAEGLTYQWPTKVQRRIYDVWIPYYSSRVAWYETNSWKTNRFYLQFRTSHRYLNQFLRDMGTSPSALREGRSGISEKRAETIGWDFHKAGHRYAGAVYHQADPQPDVAITVDETYKSRPRIYVVSTAHP